VAVPSGVQPSAGAFTPQGPTECGICGRTPAFRWRPPSIIGHFMSPASLRRYRAERLLREEFRALRGQVLASVRGSLRARGAGLDERDLEACYAQAWQGLYAATLEGQRIVNPAGRLARGTLRPAIDQRRARRSS